MNMNRNLQSRINRRREYEALRVLPFWTKEQSRRLTWLQNQVVKDNHAAFAEAKAARS